MHNVLSLYCSCQIKRMFLSFGFLLSAFDIFMELRYFFVMSSTQYMPTIALFSNQQNCCGRAGRHFPDRASYFITGTRQITRYRATATVRRTGRRFPDRASYFTTGTRQITRYRATATLRRPQIKQFTA